MNHNRVVQIAHVCHEANRALQVTAEDHNGDVSPHFTEAPEWMVTSAVAGVREALKGKTPEELHIAWSEHKTKEGWVYGETKDPGKKTHPCLVPYSELPQEQRDKDRVFSAIVNALSGVDSESKELEGEVERWKERWSATVADADEQRAQKTKVQVQYVDVVIAIRALHKTVYLKDLWGNVGPHNEDLQVCQSCSNDRDYVLYPCPTRKIVDGA